MFLNINRNKKAQLVMEYVLLVVAAILAIIAVQGIAKGLRNDAFDLHFRQCAHAAGGVTLP